MKPFFKTGLHLAAAGLFAATATAADTDLAFTIEIKGSNNVPRLIITNNSPVLEFTKFTLTIGDFSKNFDGNTNSPVAPPGGTAVQALPIVVGPTNFRSDIAVVTLTGFGPGKSFSLDLDVDDDDPPVDTFEDYHTVFFNNGNLPNATITLESGPQSVSFTLSDRTSSQPTIWKAPLLNLKVRSVAETGGTDYVSKVLVKVDDGILPQYELATDVGELRTLGVPVGSQVEISAPRQVYKDIHGEDITSSVDNEPAKIDSDAEERFSAIGISVNNVPQTGDPTLYRFEFKEETEVEVKWQQDFALTVHSDFSSTQSATNNAQNQPLAGPLFSQASGNPDPACQKHWIKRNTPTPAKIDGVVLEQTALPGLDIRYVPKAIRAYGPPRNVSPLVDSVRLTANGNVDIRQAGVVSLFPQIEARQQVDSFNMWGPGGIDYIWQIQYGVRVNVDAPSRTTLPRLVMVDGLGVETPVGSQEGVFWFDPGAHIKILTQAKAPGADGPALKGWINGDGTYFSGTGDIDVVSGALTNGSAGTGAAWIAGGATAAERGLEIYQLNRPARVMWRYGTGAIEIEATIGEYIFQHDDGLAALFTRKPEAVDGATIQAEASVTQNGAAAPGPGDVVEWDPVAGRLYPLLPGRFTVPWKPGADAAGAIDVRVHAVLPHDSVRNIDGHYPHIAGAPPVAVDPDPNDNYSFKQMRFSNCNGTVDGSKRFTAPNPGFSVLLFKEIQREGRGEPREFLRVRVVHTKTWDDGLPAAISATVGTRIRPTGASSPDKANLGTGWIRDPNAKARYNPFIYDAAKLDGLAAKDVYNMDLLLSNPGVLTVVDRSKLPGPIFPVNDAPGAPAAEKLTVVWYDNPALNDTMLWPHLVRTYEPAWPAASTQARIVIASQWGSESKTHTGGDQTVAPAAGDYPAAKTYDPSRLQAVQIYQQPDRNAPGYNPNEEHALMAPSLRFADVSPRPPAVYALRNNDLNNTSTGADYTSRSFVLVQFFDVAIQDYRMKIYQIVKEDSDQGYTFANIPTAAASPTSLNALGHVEMVAGEPVIPFYPLGVAIGASPCDETFGNNLLVTKSATASARQLTYWEDHKGTSWSVSGGANAWFEASFYYPLAPDFWWPPSTPVPPVKITSSGALNTAEYDSARTAAQPQTGSCVAFLPSNVKAAATASGLSSHLPTKVLFHSRWPVNPPVLKAGETVTFSGGENRADHPTRQIVKADGTVETVETPGLPQILAFASGEIVFDSLNPDAQQSQWSVNWTARVVQALEIKRATLDLAKFSTELQPAGGKTRLSQGKYVFNSLPASLQRRFRYDPLAQRLEFSGILNDKTQGDNSLTAAPSAVYALEPNVMTTGERDVLKGLVSSDHKTDWDNAIQLLYISSVFRDTTLLPQAQQLTLIQQSLTLFYPGLTAYIDALVSGILTPVEQQQYGKPARAFGPGLALIPNDGFLNPNGVMADGTAYPTEGWLTVVENNDDRLGGSPVTPHIIKVDRAQRYRGNVKTILSDNVFDENIVLRHTGDFGGKAGDLVFEWWYRPDDGSLNVPPPDMIPAGTPNPWKLFPDPTGHQGLGLNSITLKGNPNAPEVLLADSWWFCRYRHRNDPPTGGGSDWKPNTITGPPGSKKYDWAGAGNSDPFNDFDLDGVKDYRAQLAMGWIKRVLDAVNPYEARIRNFEGENPATITSMIAQFGPRFEGPVALNPDKDVIEHVGLIELYETVLKRGRDLSIDLSRPVSTPAIANALQLASTRIADFYTLLGNEAYTDALDPTIGYGSDSVEYGSFAPAVFAFQNQQPHLIGEELALLRGVDDYFARPVYNRLFWNFTKGEGEAAYATNYNISDVNLDGFINEADAMILYPQGHGDAWGHYLTAMRNTYELLRHPYFNWVSRSESYNLQDIVITVDFLDERKFAATAAAKAKAGAEIVNLTYRDKYVEDPDSQWQGYTDTNVDRAWGVDDWARRAGQGAYFDWVTANALLPSQHPNPTLEGVRKVDRESNADIAVISANLSAIQSTMDESNRGQNPLGLSRNALVFDIDPTFLEVGSTAQIGTRAVQGLLHFDQIYERAIKMLENTQAIWDNANESRNMLRQTGNSETEFRNATFQEDLSYRNQLIQIFGKPYEGTIGSGQVYPAGYDGPDLALFMYVPVRQINKDTVPGPSTSWATFSSTGELNGGDLYNAFRKDDSDGSNDAGTGGANAELQDVDSSVRALFSNTFSSSSNYFYNDTTTSGLFAVNYTDLTTPKVSLTNFINKLPVTAAGYTFQAPASWGTRAATGELQSLINQMLIQEAAVIESVGAWDALTGQVVRTIRLLNARLSTTGAILIKDEAFSRIKLAITSTIKGLEAGIRLTNAIEDVVLKIGESTSDAIPGVLPTAGLAFSPGDALSAAASGVKFVSVGTFTGLKAAEEILAAVKTGVEIGLDIIENELNLFEKRELRSLQIKEWLKELEDLIGDEPIRRVQIFKEIQTLRDLSEQYRAKVDEGVRLIDERAAFNKRVAAQTQRSRYQDMTLRVARNHALQSYRSAFNLAAKYAYLAAKAYDYETNYATSDPGSPQAIFSDIMRARSIGLFTDQPRRGAGGLSEALATLKSNYESQRGQLGLNTPQRETGKLSLRTQLMRILPKDSLQPVAGVAASEFPASGMDSNTVWKSELQKAKVPDLWDVAEFRNHCRPFASPTDSSGARVKQPGLVFRFGTQVTAGKNFFGKQLAGGDQAYDPTNYTTKIVGVGVWFSDYRSENVLSDLAAAPRVYLVPVGSDIMRVPHGGNPDEVRIWNVLDQAIPVPLPALHSSINHSRFIPLLDTLNGPSGELRRFSSFRAYHNGAADIDFDQLVTDSRLIGRSIWNTEWMLIVPGQALNADPDEGLTRFMDQVSDILLVFETYGLSGG